MTEDRGPQDLTLQMEKLEEENKKLKKRAEEAEGENTIIKGIGNNSPEMRELQARVKRLDESLADALEINESHQDTTGSFNFV